MDTPAIQLKDGGYKGIIISGGPNSVYDENALAYDADIFKIGIPVLGEFSISFTFHRRKSEVNRLISYPSGICYGMQMIAKALGGEVRKKEVREDGPSEIEVNTKCSLFA